MSNIVDKDAINYLDKFTISEFSTLFPDIYEKYIGELYGSHLEYNTVERIIHEAEFNEQKKYMIKEIKDRYLFNKLKKFVL